MFGLEKDKDKLEKELKLRKEDFLRKTNLTQQQVTAEMNADPDWQEDGETKSGKKLKKRKPKSDIFENEVWLFFYYLNCDYLNTGGPNSFNFPYQKLSGQTDQIQLDVVAIKDRYVFICEATAAQKRKKYSQAQKNKIDSKLSNRTEIEAEIRKNKKDAIIYWIYATKDYDWTDNFFQDAKNDKYVPLRHEEEIKYFGKLNSKKNLESSALMSISEITAFSQFLSMPTMNSLQGNRNSDYDLEIVAHKHKISNKVVAYVATVSPADIFNLISVGHHMTKDSFKEKFYQRLANPNRIKNIASYINEKNHFPNNILCSLKRKPSETKTKEKDLFKLKFQGYPGSINIIDGQHRMFGYGAADLSRHNDKVILTMYEGLSTEEEIQMFVDVNSNQSPVNRDLINALRAELVDSIDPKLLLKQECSRVMDSLMSKGHLKNYISKVEARSEGMDQITRATFSESLEGSELYKKLSNDKKSLEDGPLYYSLDPVKKFASILNLYFEDIMSSNPQFWNNKSIYNTRESIRALIKILSTIIKFSNSSKKIIPSQSAQNIYDNSIEPYIKPLKDYMKNTQFNAQHQFMHTTERGTSRLDEYVGRYGWRIKQSFSGFPINWVPPNPTGLNRTPLHRLDTIEVSIYQKFNNIMTKFYTTPNSDWWHTAMKKEYYNIYFECENHHQDRINTQSADEVYDGSPWFMMSHIQLNKVISNTKFKKAKDDFENVFASGWTFQKDQNGNQNLIEKKHQKGSGKAFQWLNDLNMVRNQAKHPGTRIPIWQVKFLEKIEAFLK